MDRRSFLFGLVGVAGAGMAGALAISSAEASVLNQLKDAIPPLDEMPEAEELAGGFTPDGTPVDKTVVYVAPVRRRRRVRVCRTVRNRWGRRVTTCRWVWR